jgi:hypothetical protein
MSRAFSALVGAALLTASAAALQRSAPPPFRFTDVAAAAGLTAVNVAGSANKDYLVESNGNGVAWFDYDNDGDQDALLVSGSRMERMRLGGDPMVVLYRNDGNGRFADVTTAAGLTRRGWGTP